MPEGALPASPMTPDELAVIVTRLQRLMPMDRDVQIVCNVLRGIIDMQPMHPADKKAKKLEAARRKAARREYMRRWMANKRASQKREDAHA